MNDDFLGKGFAFPLQTNQRGVIDVSKQEQKIKESILIILGTHHNERVMRPDFGCNLRSLVFAPNNTATANLARHYVEEGLTKWEPRIALDEVIVENDNFENKLLIRVSYRIKSTNEQGNLVYPFYLG
ncbi:GPW/gp25 family protein [Methanosarcina sp.]|uniref:GPW/gp25 family protein n=1 Tax=Methanosarcina sp. TaxID=2213 RepID=UPI003BB7F5C7